MYEEGAAGSDGFFVAFYVSCWEIIKEDIYHMVLDFLFSICINGQLAGFFHSEWGLRQRDPISPFLFIIIAEWLSRGKSSLIPFKGISSDNRVKLLLLPPISILHQMEMIMSNFFWGSNESIRRTHWIAWFEIYKPKSEGGLGIIRLKEVATTFTIKLWYRFREQKSPWANFLLKAYCSSSSPVVGWNKCRLDAVLSPDIVEKAIEVPILLNDSDIQIWKLTSNERWRHGSEWSLDGHIKEAMSFLILWSLWYARNEAKQRGYKLDGQRIIDGLGISMNMECVNTIVVVYWRKPAFGCYKLNSDGCSRGNPKASSFGVVIRDHEGQVVLAKHGCIHVIGKAEEDFESSVVVFLAGFFLPCLMNGNGTYGAAGVLLYDVFDSCVVAFLLENGVCSEDLVDLFGLLLFGKQRMLLILVFSKHGGI
ncbi:hypothetical protein ZIOFF_000753 [Zingiber officinale]|uniref:Uncharacterized protein n=1 Tax=Zingiber officinale TaxID=94328 RepID=A0A8J5IIJ0_ZINOF|nr:hypothetical protein ZIOFF_000753 [Zingiber officinale]